MSNAENYRGVFDGGLGFGEKLAVLVIGFSRAYTTAGGLVYKRFRAVQMEIQQWSGNIGFCIVASFNTVFQQIRGPGSSFYCGGKGFGVLDAIAESKPLIELARLKGVPIFYVKLGACECF